MANEIDIIVEVTGEFVAECLVDHCSASVADELAFGHFVFDVRRVQIDGEQDQREAKDVDGFCKRQRREWMGKGQRNERTAG